MQEAGNRRNSDAIMLEHLVRTVKCSDVFFGGTQRSASDCFKQLPLVSEPTLNGLIQGISVFRVEI